MKGRAVIGVTGMETYARKEFHLETTQLGRFVQLLRNEYNRWGMLFYFDHRRRATIEDFAHYLCVHPETLEKWMAQAARPTDSDLFRLPKTISSAARQILIGM